MVNVPQDAKETYLNQWSGDYMTTNGTDPARLVGTGRVVDRSRWVVHV
jgi:hypothetical protein